MWDPASFRPSVLGVYHYVGPSVVSPEGPWGIPLCGTQRRFARGSLGYTTMWDLSLCLLWDPATHLCGTSPYASCGTQLSTSVGPLLMPPVGPSYPPMWDLSLCLLWDPASFALTCGSPHNGNRPVGVRFHFQVFKLVEGDVTPIGKPSCVVSRQS